MFEKWAAAMCGLSFVLSACGSSSATDSRGATLGEWDRECAAVEDETGEPVTIRVVNDSPKPIHLGEETACASSTWLFELRGPQDQRLAALSGCSSCRDGTGVSGCPAICAPPFALRLEAGERADLVWDGLYGSSVALPQGCPLVAAGPWPNGMCQKATRATAGAYSFAVRAATALDCGEACGPCQIREAGGCVLSGALAGGVQLAAEANVDLEDRPGYGLDGPIELVLRE